MSSMRPPMLAGPIARNTYRRRSGSFDQLMGVGVGDTVGVAVAARVGAGVWVADGDGDAAGFCAPTANAPNVTAVNANPTMASSRPRRSRVERHVSFIGEFLSVSVKRKCSHKELAATSKSKRFRSAKRYGGPFGYSFGEQQASSGTHLSD